MPSQEVLKSFDRAQVRAYLSAEMWGPCPTCAEIVERDHGWGSGCPDCQGSGKQFLLRKACPDEECQRNKGQVLWTFEGQDTQFIDHPECDGVTYQFDDSPDALETAWLAKGWSLQIASHPFPVGGNGNLVIVRVGSPSKTIGEVFTDEQLRGQAASELGLARALGWKGE